MLTISSPLNWVSTWLCLQTQWKEVPTYHSLEKKTQISPQFLLEVPSLNPPTVEAENTRYSLPHILCTKLDHDPGSARMTHHFELQAMKQRRGDPTEAILARDWPIWWLHLNLTSEGWPCKLWRVGPWHQQWSLHQASSAVAWPPWWGLGPLINSVCYPVSYNKFLVCVN